jgi:hypothetical protein
MNTQEKKRMVAQAKWMTYTDLYKLLTRRALELKTPTDLLNEMDLTSYHKDNFRIYLRPETSSEVRGRYRFSLGDPGAESYDIPHYGPQEFRINEKGEYGWRPAEKK